MTPQNIRQIQILTCLAAGITRSDSYPEDLRNFCLGLYNTSPAGYRYMRNSFDNRIPAPVTIQSWYANSNIDCQPGILSYSLSVLRRKAAEYAAKNQKLIGGLLFDEMNIYKMIQWVGNKMIGYEYIPGIDIKTAGIASEVLVFMFTGMNETLHLPVAYYFTKKLDANLKSNLIENIMEAIIDTGVCLHSVTFDGFSSNPAAVGLLGANLNVFSESFKPSFILKNHEINVFYDPSHVMKLIRGILANQKVLIDADGGKIKWAHYENLVKFKNDRNLGLIHKMTQAHIKWSSNPMNVQLAVQTLSSSTADAMFYLKEKGYRQFADAGPTIKFNRIVDRFFDISNSTFSSESKENIFKRPMCADNIEEMSEFFKEAIPYIKGLKYQTSARNILPLCTSASKTGFVGCIMNMTNLEKTYTLLSGTYNVTRFPTHSISQDHLESTFGRLRALNGSGNNPTCMQFNSGMRKLLCNTTLHYSDHSNCLAPTDTVYNPYSNILKITSNRPKAKSIVSTNEFTPEEIESVLSELSQIQTTANPLLDLSDITTAHIAHSIQNLVEKHMKCECLENIFIENELVHESFMRQGQRKIACKSTFEICKNADYFLKFQILKGQFEVQLIFNAIFSGLNMDNLFMNTKFEDAHKTHKVEFIQKIVCEYVRIKGTYIAKTVTFNERSADLRRKLTRMVINYNQ